MTAMLDSESGRTIALSNFVSDPPAVIDTHREAARLILIDTIGVAIAGTRTPAYSILRDWLGEACGAESALWGTGAFRDPSSAALANGLAGHALDWDDASPTRWLHTGTVLWPALLASLRPGQSGADLVRGFSVGSTLFRALSDILPLGVHYGRGWHNTSTTGRLAAAAAVSASRRLDPTAVARAMALAASTASGSLANFGTMTKPLHAGLAARDAVMAVDLAERGFTASTQILDDPRGFVGLYGDVEASAKVDLDERIDACWHGWTTDYAIKRFPSCYATQRAIDAAQQLRRQLDAPARSVEVFVEPDGLLPLQSGTPQTGLEAKFSLPYTIAVTLLTGQVRLADFEDAALGRPDIRTLMDRVECRETAAPPLGPSLLGTQATVLCVTTDSGRQFVARVDHARGDARKPIDPNDLTDKFAECAQVPIPTAVSWVDQLGAILESADLSSAQHLLAGNPNPQA